MTSSTSVGFSLARSTAAFTAAAPSCAAERGDSTPCMPPIGVRAIEVMTMSDINAPGGVRQAAIIADSAKLRGQKNAAAWATIQVMSVFNHPEFDGHELIAFHTERESGLRAIIAVHNT